MSETLDRVEAAIGRDRIVRALERFNVPWEARYGYPADLVLAAIIVELSLELDQLRDKVAGIQEVNGLWDGS